MTGWTRKEAVERVRRGQFCKYFEGRADRMFDGLEL